MHAHINNEYAQLISYFRDPTALPEPNNGNNVEEKGRYLQVNCAGRCYIPVEFLRVQPHGREDYYLMYLCSGTLSVYIGDPPEDEHLLLTPGQLFIYPPHITFRYENAAQAPICYLWVHATGYGVPRLLADCALPVGTPLTVGAVSQAEERFRALFQTLLLHEPFFEVSAAAQFMEIAAMFGQALAQEQQQIRSAAEVQGDNVRRIYTSLSYLHENIAKPLSVAALAEMEHFGVSRYRTLFREATGMSPIAYITELRMQRAAELLTHTELPVIQVAQSVGYEDPLYFSRVFRQRWGVSPAIYGSRRRTDMQFPSS